FEGSRISQGEERTDCYVHGRGHEAKRGKSRSATGQRVVNEKTEGIMRVENKVTEGRLLECHQTLLSIAALILLSFCAFSCRGEDRHDDEIAQKDAESWTVTVHGKVSYPQQGGSISIQRISEDGTGGWQDTIQLKSDNTFSKK